MRNKNTCQTRKFERGEGKQVGIVRKFVGATVYFYDWEKWHACTVYSIAVSNAEHGGRWPRGSDHAEDLLVTESLFVRQQVLLLPLDFCSDFVQRL